MIMAPAILEPRFHHHLSSTSFLSAWSQSRRQMSKKMNNDISAFLEKPVFR